MEKQTEVQMFSFVYGGECGMCGMPKNGCPGHAGLSGVTDVLLVRAVCDTEPISYRDAHAEVGMTMGDINAILDSDKLAWCVSAQDVKAISDGAAVAIAKSIVSNDTYTRAIKKMANGESFGIVELTWDCRMLLNGRWMEENEALTALAYWAFEKLATGIAVACSGCGESTRYVFSVEDIGPRIINGCGDRYPRITQND
jgi:hypothetical protein